ANLDATPHALAHSGMDKATILEQTTRSFFSTPPLLAGSRMSVLSSSVVLSRTTARSTIGAVPIPIGATDAGLTFAIPASALAAVLSMKIGAITYMKLSLAK